jgi:hypothetical protein
MRFVGLIFAAAVVLPSTALAQHTSGGGTPMGDLQDLNRFATRGFMNQWSATRPASLSGFSPETTAWLKDQVQIQAESPRPVEVVAAAIDAELGDAIRQAAKQEKTKPQDVSRAILLKVMLDTKSALAREARRVKGVPEPGALSWEARIARADDDRRAAMKMQSGTSLALATD